MFSVHNKCCILAGGELNVSSDKKCSILASGSTKSRPSVFNCLLISFPHYIVLFSLLLLLLLLLFLHWLCAALCTWTRLNSQRLINIRNIYVYYTQRRTHTSGTTTTTSPLYTYTYITTHSSSRVFHSMGNIHTTGPNEALIVSGEFAIMTLRVSQRYMSVCVCECISPVDSFQMQQLREKATTIVDRLPTGTLRFSVAYFAAGRFKPPRQGKRFSIAYFAAGALSGLRSHALPAPRAYALRDHCQSKTRV